jgi:hypothetical protein
MKPRVLFVVAVLLLGLRAERARAGAEGGPKFELGHNEVVAFIGGADVAAAQFSGQLEALLAVKYQGVGVRFRNFGWEGDTVFSQPRDVGFPPLKAHLKKAGATLLVFQLGRMESFGGAADLPRFVAAYERMLDECGSPTARSALVTPPPFEKARGHLPDLTPRNADLGAYAQAIREVAKRRELPLVDLFEELRTAAYSEERLTSDGLQLTPRGEGLVARAFADQAGFGDLAKKAGDLNPDGDWSNPAFEKVRLAAIAKNRLWFEYWRPQNWAFLGGDRTEQPSSRDHRDRNIRWFPAEMEKFIALIEQAEAKMSAAAEEATK